MEISINNKKTIVEVGMHLSDVISLQLGHAQSGIAVAINSEVISKSQWHEIKIQPNDNILIIKATQGG